MEREKQFRKRNSNVAKAYPFVKAGESRQEIGGHTGLHGDALTQAISGNYRRHVMPLSPEERKRRLVVNTSIGKGGVKVAVEPYFKMDLTARQTQIAIEAETGTVFSVRQIGTAYTREVVRHGLSRASGINLEAQRDKKRTREELLAIVERRKVAFKYIKDQQLPRPVTVAGWQNIEEIDKTVTQLRSKLPYGTEIPTSRDRRLVLIELLERADHFQREGVWSLQYSPQMYVAPGEDWQAVVKELTPQLKALQQKYLLTKDQMLRLLYE